jgi:hypothetical protein
MELMFFGEHRKHRKVDIPLEKKDQLEIRFIGRILEKKDKEEGRCKPCGNCSKCKYV